MTTRPTRFLFLGLAFASLSLFAAGRPLAPRTLGPTSFQVSLPQTAYAGGRFLTTWQESMGLLGTHVMGAFSDAHGARISPRSFRLDVPPANWYRLAGRNESFTVFWQDGSERTWMADVDLEGRVTGARTVALPPHSIATFVWNGTHFLAVMQSPALNNLSLAMFDANGQLVFPATTIPDYIHAFDVAVADGRFVAVLSGEDAVFAHEITPSGLGARVIAKWTGPNARPSRLVSAPLANGDVLVVWSAGLYPRGELPSVILHRDGTREDESLLATSDTGVTPVDVLRSGDGYVLVYSSAGSGVAGESIWSVRLDASGTPAGEPVRVADNVNSGGVILPSAVSPAAILVAHLTTIGVWNNVSSVAIGAGGQARAPEILSTTLSRQMQPVLGAGRGEVLAVWREVAGDSDVRAASVDADGQPRAAVQVAPSVLVAKDTAWNGAHHLVVHADGNRMLATRVTADGTVADASPIVLAELPWFSYPETAVVWAGTRWVVVWTEADESGRIQSLTVSADGAPSAVRTLDVHVPIPEDWSRGVSHPALAFDGDHVLLVWSEWQMPFCWQLCFTPSRNTYAVRLTRSGAEYDRRPLDLNLLDAPGIAVASSGSEFLVAAGQHARVVRSAAELEVVAARDLFEWPATSDVTWDGTRYVVALRYYGWLTDWYLGVLRLDRGGNDVAVRRGTATLAADTFDAPSIAAPFSGNALIGVHEGTPDDGVGAVLYRERDLAALPPPPGAPRDVRVRSLGQFRYEVMWEAPADGNAVAYIIEQFQADRWIIVSRAPGDARHAYIHAYSALPIVRVRAFNAGGPSGLAEVPHPGPTKRRSVR